MMRLRLQVRAAVRAGLGRDGGREGEDNGLELHFERCCVSFGRLINARLGRRSRKESCVVATGSKRQTCRICNWKYAPW